MHFHLLLRPFAFVPVCLRHWREDHAKAKDERKEGEGEDCSTHDLKIAFFILINFVMFLGRSVQMDPGFGHLIMARRQSIQPLLPKHEKQ